MIHTNPDRFEAGFAASLHPEIFYALQVLADRRDRGFGLWQKRALAVFPRAMWSLDLPGAVWPALADVPKIVPTRELQPILKSIAGMPAREFQERFLVGLLHVEDAVRELLDGGDPAAIVARIPRKKREWLAFVDLYPLESHSPTTLAVRRVVDDPERFRDDLIATLEGFWDAVFSATWKDLLPELEASVKAKRRLFDTLSFPEFLRHTLLPIEYDSKKRSLRALRGGYELPVAEMARCTFTPSVFNTQRLWTVESGTEGEAPWLPYFEPDLGPRFAAVAESAGSEADIALIFRALGDTTRFAMVSLIGRQPHTSVELAKLLSVSRPTISHHIHILRSAGLIREMEFGGSVLLSLRKRQFARLSELALERIFESRDAVEPIKTRRNR